MLRLSDVAFCMMTVKFCEALLCTGDVMRSLVESSQGTIKFHSVAAELGCVQHGSVTVMQS